MKQVTVNKNAAGQRIDRFLAKTYPELPQSLICKTIRKKDIKVNGKRTEASYKLNEGDVITLYIKDEFFEKVWETDYVSEVTLNVHIRHLREKIEEDPSHPVFIKTVWGVGFMMEV